MAGTTLYVADTNNHEIRAIDLESKAVKTLDLDIVKPPTRREHADVPERDASSTSPPSRSRRQASSRFDVDAGPCRQGYKLNRRSRR